MRQVGDELAAVDPEGGGGGQQVRGEAGDHRSVRNAPQPRGGLSAEDGEQRPAGRADVVDQDPQRPLDGRRGRRRDPDVPASASSCGANHRAAGTVAQTPATASSSVHPAA
ncbi:MAG: hypothetical protein ACLP8S_06305 [Solirubrobacteraceae bacterium]